MTTPIVDLTTGAGRAIVDLFRSIKEDIEQSDGSWPGADVVQTLTLWFAGLGIDPDLGDVAALVKASRGAERGSVAAVRTGLTTTEPAPLVPAQRDREELELALRQALNEDCAVDAAFRVIEAGWRSPTEWAALEAERTALAAALDDGRHVYQGGGAGGRACSYLLAGDTRVICLHEPDDPVHRTSAWVRANHGHGAT